MSICQSTLINRDRAPPKAQLPGAEGQSARGLHSGGPVQGSSRRSVTATWRFARHRGLSAVRKKVMHENKLCQPVPASLRRRARNQLLIVQVSHSVFICEIREIRGQNLFHVLQYCRTRVIELRGAAFTERMLLVISRELCLNSALPAELNMTLFGSVV